MAASTTRSARGSFMSSGQQEPDVFSRSARHDDEEELRWAAIERLPTYNRMTKSVLTQALEGGRVESREIDVKNLGGQERRHLMEKVVHAVEEDHERFLRKIRSRQDSAGIARPKIEIRFEELAVDGDVYVGSRALPSLMNATLNSIESILGLIKIIPSKKRKIQILKDANGIIKPSRMTLLLGPPGSGKTTFLQALSGKLDHTLKKSGKITYCGHEFNEFVPQRTSAYIGQHDLHYGEMTVRETLDFSGRCLGVGSRYEMLAELLRHEKEAGIRPDSDIDAFMKSIAISGQKTSFVTDYVLKLLGLDMCSDIYVGDGMRRGISGGQKKRVTTGEMLVGPAKALLMDEISSGLDSSTTLQIVKYMAQISHVADVTMVISLLQPDQETYNLFDDIILLTEGYIVYQGPRDNVLEFFEFMGFQCPQRKVVADFLQEVTSKKDQEQYWSNNNQPYRYIPAQEFSVGFRTFHVGQMIADELRVPYDKSNAHPAPLVKETYGLSNWELFHACFSREVLVMRRNSFVYVFKTAQITIMAILAFTVFFRTEMPYGRLVDGGKFYGALFFSLTNVMFNCMAELSMTVARLSVFYKQRKFLFYPAWAFALPIWITRIPISVIESMIWIITTHYTMGFAPSVGRVFRDFLAFFSMNQMAFGMFRCIAAVGRAQVVADALGTFSLLLVFVLGGFVVAKDDLMPWLKWAYYCSPMSYGQNAIVMNEFLDQRWSTPNTDPLIDQPTVGKALLKSRGYYTEDYWFWICIVALMAFSVLFNLIFIAALTFLNPLGASNATLEDEDSENSSEDMEMQQTSSRGAPQERVLMPFQPLSLVFHRVNYYVDMPAEMKAQGAEGDRLQLLRDVSGAFKPGVLTALMGVSGAGKTTLMDVLAGRKTGGYIEGNVKVSGYAKNQETFARISGYCEQNDIHSPYVTVYESVLYSAWLRLPANIQKNTRKMFIEEVMKLVELNPVRNSLVGLPGVSGLSTEQRKRLTIAVELVANPSIIFMDEPTSGLDARAANIVMRTVRNTVDTGRTVVCTIHQPNIDIFEAFDELLLMKRGGRVIFAGQLGRQAENLIEYFEAIPGVRKIEEGYNPAAWMLEVTTTAAENQLGEDFANVYIRSSLYQRNEEIINEASIPAPGSTDLEFPMKYSQPFFEQCKVCFWKQFWSYWRNPQYNVIRFFLTIVIALIFGLIFLKKGQKTSRQQDLNNLLGAIYSTVFFLGATNATSVQGVVSIERTVFYREKAAGMYAPLPYAFAQVAIETVYVCVQSVIYCLILYVMIGFDWSDGKFFWFFYFVFMSLVYFTLYGMMFIALTPGHQVATIVACFFLSFWNLFSGFILPRMQIPIWWRWYYWGSPVAWSIYGLVTSQLGDLTSQVEVPGLGYMTVQAYIKQNLGFDRDFLPVVAFMHLVFVVLFAFIFALGIKYLNFQKR